MILQLSAVITRPIYRGFTHSTALAAAEHKSE